MRGPAAAHIGILLLTFAASPLLAATNLINLQSKTHGPISFSMDASSDAVHLDKGLLLTLSYRAPEHIQITPPDLGTRFTGFTIDTQFQAEPDRTGTTVLYKTKLRLLPEISHEYRIAPFSVEYRDIQDPSAKTHWFATKPVTLSVVSPLPPGQPNDLGSVTAPVWIAPDTATILIYLGYATAGLLIAWTLFRVIRTLRNRVKEAKRNPREVALGRLDALLARKLIETGDVKTFYFELSLLYGTTSNTLMRSVHRNKPRRNSFTPSARTHVLRQR